MRCTKISNHITIAHNIYCVEYVQRNVKRYLEICVENKKLNKYEKY